MAVGTCADESDPGTALSLPAPCTLLYLTATDTPLAVAVSVGGVGWGGGTRYSGGFIFGIVFTFTWNVEPFVRRSIQQVS